ncbi:TPA: beta(1,3)galactosyltransferase EpsH [Clostridium perfringens]|nr:PssE/Cps14G family polysaccharide biosynthesis glycosyltransferase [Clostridium perfringens]HAT4180134.1 beta(1,3)galactosyltransferase EpsH [Clostridium perfringens]
MIFITVGSRSFQFNRLLEAVDEAIENKEIKDEVFAQVGSSDYKPKFYKYIDFMNQDEFNKMISKCDIVITHGGTGVIVNSVKKGKKVVAVPRLAKFNEVVDDHQLQLVREFERMRMIIACYDCNDIGKAVHESKSKEAVVYKSNTESIINSIRNFISSR